MITVLIRARDRAVRPGLALPLLLPLAAFALVTVLSAAASARPAVAFFESKSLVFATLFFAAVNGFRSTADIADGLRWFYGAVTLASAYAMVQTWACSTVVDLPAWVGTVLRVRLETCRAVPPFRAKGFFSIYMTLGGSLLVALALIASVLAHGARRVWWPAIAGILASVSLALTYVRSAWVGLAVATGVLLGLTRRAMVVAPALLLVALALGLSAPLATRMRSMVNPDDPTARERLYMWEAGLRMMRDAPLLGLGPGGVRQHYPEYRDPRTLRPRTGHLHNNLVQIAAERGLAGLLTWAWIWVAFFVRAGRIYRALPSLERMPRALTAGSIAAVAGFLVSGLFEYNFGDAEVLDLVWLIMAFPFVCERETTVAGRPAVS